MKRKTNLTGETFLYKNNMPRPLKAALLILFLAGIFLSSCLGSKTKQASYEFTNIRRGDVERTVSASGTINPVATVKILPQMGGKVENIFVDYNDIVKKGQILAELNTDMLKLQREQQSASVQKARANYELQLINLRNQEALAEKNLISEYEYKTVKTTLDNQAADLAVAEANLKEIETKIDQYAFITSPIDGIVLDRKINVGDTVVDSSSNNTSAIFTLAENLEEMQIEAVVGELDVVNIQKGQPVRFTLESLPGRSFSGEVETLRMVPVVTNSVVSYTVIVKVGNQDGSLLPGMTCAVDFIVERGEDVLLVSNAALRYQPTTLGAEKISDMVFNASIENLNEEQRQAAITERNQAQAGTQQGASGQTNRNADMGLTSLVMGGQGTRGGVPRVMTGGGQRGGGGQGQNVLSQKTVVLRNIWYMNSEDKLEVMQVRSGITNGSLTEIEADTNIEGRQVILREKI